MSHAKRQPRHMLISLATQVLVTIGGFWIEDLAGKPLSPVPAVLGVAAVALVRTLLWKPSD